MTGSFEWVTAPRILFGRGQLERLGDIVASLGQMVLLVRGGQHLESTGVIARLVTSLAGRPYIMQHVSSEPRVGVIDAMVLQAREAGCDVVVGVGGGAVLDAAKAVAGLLTHEGSALDYLEVVGAGRPITRPAAPLIAIPTTAGTGSEVTRNAVLTYEPKHFKASMRSVHLVPRVALVDPSLTDTVPPAVTAATGLDALTQLIEPYVCSRAQPITDALAVRGIELAARALVRAYENGRDTAARDDMALASLLGGMCLANAGLGAVHGFAAPLGASFPIPHGVACAALLPHVMAANVAALRMQKQRAPVLARYAHVGRLLTQQSIADDDAAIDAGIERTRQLVTGLGIPKLASFGVESAHVSEIVQRAKRASSMRANPVLLTDEQLAHCLQAAM